MRKRPYDIVGWKMIVLILLSVLAFYWIGIVLSGTVEQPTIDLVLIDDVGGTHVVSAEIADSPELRQRGLMNRTSLAPDTGMLFVFEQELPLYFWMKNTLLPLDILFFEADGDLVSTASMVPCKKDPCQSYSSGRPAFFALEVASGYVQDQGVNKNWRIDLENLSMYKP
jgi:hypothetical protein